MTCYPLWLCAQGFQKPDQLPCTYLSHSITEVHHCEAGGEIWWADGQSSSAAWRWLVQGSCVDHGHVNVHRDGGPHWRHSPLHRPVVVLEVIGAVDRGNGGAAHCSQHLAATERDQYEVENRREGCGNSPWQCCQHGASCYTSGWRAWLGSCCLCSPHTPALHQWWPEGSNHFKDGQHCQGNSGPLQPFSSSPLKVACCGGAARHEEAIEPGTICSNQVELHFTDVRSSRASKQRCQGSPRRWERHIELKLSGTQWDLAKEVVGVLKPLQTATTVLSMDTNPSLSCVYPVVHGLVNQHLVVRNGDSVQMQKLKERVASDLEERFHLQPAEDADVHVAWLASALDPRFKQLFFLSEQNTPAVWSYVRSRVERLSRMAADADDSNSTEEEEEQKQEGESTGSISAMSFLIGAISSGSPKTPESDEVTRYKAEPAVLDTEDPLKWWKKNEERFPVLAQVCKSIPSIPATSTPSERPFSAAGLICSKKRVSLSREHADMLCFLNRNCCVQEWLAKVVVSLWPTVPGFSDLLLVNCPTCFLLICTVCLFPEVFDCACVYFFFIGFL